LTAEFENGFGPIRPYPSACFLYLGFERTQSLLQHLAVSAIRGTFELVKGARPG
jgi:hypothetical protein